jgi:tRNA threonylcarbamoyladenosine biosynthesis protein TsaB
MILLACQTSTLLGSVAVVENGKVIGQAESMRQGSHSDSLNLLVDDSLKQAGKCLSDIDLYVSCIGPGSFTGIRISVNTIKTYAFCHQKPVLGVTSLKVLAEQVRQLKTETQSEKYLIVSMINAYKNMCYVSTYEPTDEGLIELKKPEVVRVQNLNQYIAAKSIVVGDGFSTYQKYFPQDLSEKMIRLTGAEDEPHASVLGMLAEKELRSKSSVALQWNELLPLYLRASEAEENLHGIKFQALI